MTLITFLTPEMAERVRGELRSLDKNRYTRRELLERWARDLQEARAEAERFRHSYLKDKPSAIRTQFPWEVTK